MRRCVGRRLQREDDRRDLARARASTPGTWRASACIASSSSASATASIFANAVVGLRDDRLQLGAAGIVEAELQHEAVELRLRQRIGAVQLDRVLRREHAERPSAAGSWSRPTVTVPSCIASSSALCVRGEARLISSASNRLAEHRAPPEIRTCRPSAGSWREHGRTSDVSRQQVGRELDAAVRSATPAAKARAIEVLPSPGTPSSSACPPAIRQISTPRTASR